MVVDARFAHPPRPKPGDLVSIIDRKGHVACAEIQRIESPHYHLQTLSGEPATRCWVRHKGRVYYAISEPS